jgi:RNA polymerase sigma factor (sigma-70 family)
LTQIGSTRVSLLLRIRDASDTASWEQFADIYGPLVFRYARKHGLQEADAADLVQDVLREVSQAIERFEYDAQVGKFRSWLFTIARYALSNQYRRRKRQPVGSGDENVGEMLEQLPSKEDDQDFWDQQYQKQLFQWAVEQIRHQFQESTWQAFWLTAVDGEKSALVAERLGISIGAVYVSKN